ncbi:hypothetical protein Ahy_B10g103063 isoform A [Arachis hypogaea]|uniref:Uncharacterized protein n=1 Tax=Arachis hypogaea TaxID=3818 RepID=A0A444X399_ARAHY|nr:hypothetical protein Ahy_B10g103063 isoform A [Arachis hypogaea]
MHKVEKGKTLNPVNAKFNYSRMADKKSSPILVILGILWGVSGALVKAKFKNGGSGAELWFACMV